MQSLHRKALISESQPGPSLWVLTAAETADDWKLGQLLPTLTSSGQPFFSATAPTSDTG